MDRLEVLNIFQLMTKQGKPMPTRLAVKTQHEADDLVVRWEKLIGNTGGVRFVPTGGIMIRVCDKIVW